MIPDCFKSITETSLPVGTKTPVTFSEVSAPIVGPRIRVSAPAPANEGWFIQMNPVDPSKESEWFTVPSSARLPDGSAYYDSSPKVTAPKWWRAIRKT